MALVLRSTSTSFRSTLLKTCNISCCKKSLSSLVCKTFKTTPPYKRLSQCVTMAHSSSYTPTWKQQKMIVHLNKKRFEECMGGVYYNVRYIDSCGDMPPGVSDQYPVALGLPDSPGSHEDLIALMEPLAYRGMRVIIVNFPGFDYTSNMHKDFLGNFVASSVNREYWMHSTVERSDFVRQFLVRKLIRQVDLAVGFGAGIPPIITYLNYNKVIKSSLMICPIPVHKLLNFAKPFWFSRRVNTFEFQGIPLFLLDLMGLLYKFILNRGRKFKTINETLSYLQLCHNVGFTGLPDYTKELAFCPEPISVAVTTKDPYIEYADYLEFLKLLRISDEHTWQPKPGEPLKVCPPNEYNKRALVFEMNSHFPQLSPNAREVLFQEMLYLINLGKNVASTGDSQGVKV